MPKFYRVKKDTPTWKAGAIIKTGLVTTDNYSAISDLWDVVENKDDRFIWTEDPNIVENSPEWFERVYDISILGKVKYLVKDAAIKAHEELHETGE